MGTRQAAWAVALVAAAALSACGRSQVEADFARHRPQLACYEGSTDEESCGGTWLKVYMSPSEVRKLEWETLMSQRLIRREFYLKAGRPQLVVETSYWLLDDEAQRLATPRHEYTRRYWLADLDQQSEGSDLRGELNQHASDLLKHFVSHRVEFNSATVERTDGRD